MRGETTSSSIHGGFPPQIPAPNPTPWFPQSPFTGDRKNSNWMQPVVLLIFPFFILQVPFSVGFPRERRIFPSYTTSHLEPSGHLAGLDVKVGKSMNIPRWEHPPAASAKETLHFHQHLTKHQKHQPQKNPQIQQRKKERKLSGVPIMEKNQITTQDKTQNCKKQRPHTWGSWCPWSQECSWDIFC